VTPNQGIRILFAEDARAVFRLSGTGTSGATLRVYLERFAPDPSTHGATTAEALAAVSAAAREIAAIERFTGRREPSVVT
jgi:phosphoglucomutase